MKDINLMPDKAKLSKPDEVSVKKPAAVSVKGVLTAVVIIAAIGITLYIPKVQIMSIENNINNIMIEMTQRKYGDLKALRSQIESINTLVATKQNVINTIDDKSQQVMLLLNSVKQAVPEGCFIDRIEIDKGRLTVSGLAKDSFIASEFLANLKRLSLFSNAEDGDISVQDLQASYKFSYSFNIGGEGGK